MDTIRFVDAYGNEKFYKADRICFVGLNPADSVAWKGINALYQTSNGQYWLNYAPGNSAHKAYAVPISHPAGELIQLIEWADENVDVIVEKAKETPPDHRCGVYRGDSGIICGHFRGSIRKSVITFPSSDISNTTIEQAIEEAKEDVARMIFY